MIIMNENIEVYSDYDLDGRWVLKVRKKKGKFTLDEITEVAKNWIEGVYAVIIRALDLGEEQYGEKKSSGDYIELYDAEKFFNETK